MLVLVLGLIGVIGASVYYFFPGVLACTIAIATEGKLPPICFALLPAYLFGVVVIPFILNL